MVAPKHSWRSVTAAAQLVEWREKPGLFVRQVLGATPDSWQDEVLEAFAKRENQRLALKACKGPGKSTLMAWCGWNFLLTRPHPKVVATSISGDNLRDGLWAEMAKWQGHSLLLKSAFQWSAERITSRQHPETWWASARQWAKQGDPSQQANTLAGIHADYVLFLVDEAGGIPDGVVGAAEAGLATGIETKLFISGNPTHLEGPLYRACTKERALWWVKEISSAPSDPNRTPRVSLEWAQQQIDKYGPDNPWVLVNVFGQFPPGQSNALIGVEEAGQAALRVIHEADYRDSVRILGVDIARFGEDRSVLFPRQGQAAFKPKVYRNLDTMELAGQVADFIVRWKPHAVFADMATFGAGVVDRLRQLGHNVVGVDFGGKSAQPRYRNRRAQMWFGMAEWLRGGGAIPDMPELISELVAPVYKFDEAGKLQLEKKAEVKKRVGVSPDLADALALTFAQPVGHPEVSPGRGYYEGGNGPKAVTDYDPYAGTR